METIFQYICSHASNAHYLFFGLLLLSGMNIPISEDLTLLMGGIMAKLCIPENPIELYLWIFLGCILSGWETYWIGRLLGNQIYRIPLLKKIVSPERIEKIRVYSERYGMLTFIIGRFIPCGFRNALFLATGMGKMPFSTFLIRDFCGALISSSVIYTIGYQCADHADSIFVFFKSYEKAFLLIILCLLGYFLIKRHLPIRRTT